MSFPQEPAYPDPPWRLRGQQWGGLFKTEQPVQAKAASALGAKPIFERRLGLSLLQYTSGTLTYDELIVAIPVWIGWRPWLWIRDIWVSDLQSQAAGIQVWNLPKRMASFQRDGKRVTIEDDQGLVAKFSAKPTTTHWPWAIGLVPFAGLKSGNWKTATAVWQGRVSFAKPIIEAWSDRFEERLIPGSGLGFSSAKFWMKVPAAKPR